MRYFGNFGQMETAGPRDAIPGARYKNPPYYQITQCGVGFVLSDMDDPEGDPCNGYILDNPNERAFKDGEVIYEPPPGGVDSNAALHAAIMNANPAGPDWMMLGGIAVAVLVAGGLIYKFAF